MKNIKKSIKQNIFFVYILTVLQYSWFWAAIWVLFYLRFTDYAGIGFLESIMIGTTVIGEIPTGAIADLLGKKYTLTLAFFFGFIGNLIMGMAPSFFYLSLGVIGATLGGVLTSGTIEALIYDSLLSIKEERKYQKVLGNISSIKMATLAVASITGGFAYKLSPSLPFFLVAVMQLLALFFTVLLTEPPIDSEIFSWKNYVTQTKKGFQELFKTNEIKIKNFFIIAMTMIVVINGEVLIETQLVTQGWTEIQLGIIVSLMYFFSAGMGQLTAFFNKKFGMWLSNVFAAIAISVTMLLIPYIGILLGTGLIMLRNGLIEIFGNSASANINSTTQSKYRATTLSTYSMLVSIPYALTAYLIGSLMDVYSVHVVTAVIGVVLLTIAGGAFVWRHRK